MSPAHTSPVKSAARVLQVLEHFRDVRVPQSLKQITEALGYPQSSTTVLLKSLISLGYLNYDRVRRVYFPTLRVADLGDWVANELLGRGRMNEAMRDVANATGETVSIAVQNDVFIQYIRVIQSTHPLRFFTEEGSMRPLVESALGWLLMSTHPDDEVERLIRRANIAVSSPDRRVPVAQMMETVAALRHSKVAYAEGVPLQGGATVCVLLPVAVHDQPAVLGLGGALDRIRPMKARYTTLLKRAAQGVLASTHGK
jgi:IclR family KDG regulon transcriptional repressor